jgi:PAS domain S-box-containing protein
LPDPQRRDSSDLIRVLHVDDDQMQLSQVKLFLETLNPSLKVTSTCSPVEALKQIRSDSFDCVVSDFVMPGMNGIEFAQNVREMEDVPLILYTGQGSEEVAEAAFAVGIDDYLRKEIDPSHYKVLVKRIRNAVEKHRTEALYHNVVEDTRDALSITIDTKIVYANQAFADLFGVERPEKLMGREALDWLLPKEREIALERSRQRQIGDLQPMYYEYHIKRRNGKIIPVETSSSLINYNGKQAVLSFTRDISERKKMEEERRRSEERLRALVELAPDGIVTLDLKGYVTSVNTAFTKLAGFRREDVLGKHFIHIGTLPTSDLPGYIKIFGSIVRGKIPAPLEFVYQRLDGTTGWSEARIGLITVGDKREMIAIVRDITERKMIEEELREYNQHLEQLVDERTQRLLESERMIAAGKIAAIVGHDLHGPLQTIKNASSLLKKNPEKVDELLRVIDGAVETSLRLLEDIRDNTGEMSLQIIETDVASVVRQAVAENSPSEKVEIQLSLYEDLPMVQVDQLKIRRVLDNLIRNAIEAMPEGGILHLSAKENADELVVKVSDTGEGIPSEVLDSLFKPFKTTRTNGTGLGLAFCKSVMEAHNGAIHVKSESGVGTTFTLTLPLERRPEPPPSGIDLIHAWQLDSSDFK